MYSRYIEISNHRVGLVMHMFVLDTCRTATNTRIPEANDRNVGLGAVVENVELVAGPVHGAESETEGDESDGEKHERRHVGSLSVAPHRSHSRRCQILQSIPGSRPHL